MDKLYVTSLSKLTCNKDMDRVGAHAKGHNSLPPCLPRA